MSPRVANQGSAQVTGAPPSRARNVLAAIPVGVLALLLLAAIWFDGGFDLRYWALIAILALVTLATAVAAGARLERGPLAAAVAAIWAFAAWTLLSSLWAESPASAWEGAARTILFAALITSVVTLPGRRQALKLGMALVAGLGLTAVAMLIVLHADGEDAFLAGRLDDPIGYRNATATLFAFGFWPLIGLAAERGRAPPLRAVCLSVAVLTLGLAFLTQSRGLVLGLAAGAVVFLAIGPDRVRRAWLALAAGGGVAVASGWLLEPYHAFQDGEAVSASVVDEAVAALTVLTVAALAVGFFLALLDNGLRATSAGDTARRIAAVGLVAVAAGGAVVGLAAIGNPVSYTEEKWDEFSDTESAEETGTTRLSSVSGQRYDLWRVALSEFSSQPLAGVGEGNYQFGYYEERRTDRNLSDPHGLPFRLLSETGIVGTVLLFAALAALGVAIARSARSAAEPDRRVVAGLAAAGTAVTAQSMVDWLWLIPAVTGLGLLALALAAVPRGREEDRRTQLSLGRHDRLLRRLARFGSATLLAAAALSIALLFLSDLYVREARSEIGRSPEEQLSAARKAEDLNPTAVTPLYLQASALETMGEREAAREALEQARRQEPGNFVTLALLGDLEIRAGRAREAREHYRRASELNPLDVGLQQLAGNAPAPD